MKESNQLHAVCLDTKPPLFYMSDATKAIIERVEAINEAQGHHVIAYTVDAGSNIFLITLSAYQEHAVGLLDSQHFSCRVGPGTHSL